MRQCHISNDEKISFKEGIFRYHFSNIDNWMDIHLKVILKNFSNKLYIKENTCTYDKDISF